ncbi:lysophospholipid acyltransferase family protein [Catenuloplanes indicus]|uniref:1-acyl-sn-glycerol-3-phosphate acyltransferase n=1 Tax=Catenuloplanes indicus TaxID=137267 RepID=A0AAE3W6U7_9ACTN|nr:lysophospholipid acyltransferase family protein [Catenuloplanes indicus]MDQ0370701.1 1-acyl-sn-glycerol-3-phosphate acyltransferase [Catenuloplanes indicus]
MKRNRSAAGTGHAGRIPPVYRAVMAAAGPIVRWWGRLEVTGLHHLPAHGATIVAANHDSMWDPVVIAVAARRHRQIHALAKASLWNNALLRRVLDGMGQIPVRRGEADTDALDAAVRCLTGGGCLGIFPEGTRSQGRRLRARSGAGRLAQAVPEAHIVCAAVSGTVDIARFPRRPRLKVTFFAPTPPPPSESARELAARLTAELRAVAPVATAGRRRPPDDGPG